MGKKFNSKEAEQIVIRRVNNLKSMGYDMSNHEGVFSNCRTDLNNTFNRTQSLCDFLNNKCRTIIIGTNLLIKDKPKSSTDILLELGCKLVYDNGTSKVFDLF
jgi:hypothetical protein